MELLNFDYGELIDDKEYVDKCENLKENLLRVQSAIDHCLALKENYEQLPNNAKIEVDLFLVYALNCLQWIHLRIQGIDPTNHPIKNELQRIKKTMLRWQEVKDREKRPKVDKEAAKRFVKHGIYDPNAAEKPPNKKIRFED